MFHKKSFRKKFNLNAQAIIKCKVNKTFNSIIQSTQNNDENIELDS